MRYFLIILLQSLILQAFSQAQDWDTYYEKSGFLETPRYDKTIRYCRQLSDASPAVHYLSFGKSAQGRDLPLLIVNKEGDFDPASVHRSNHAVVMIQACIHAGEPDGKDAGLMLIRDLVIAKLQPEILDHVTILFIPIFNADGHERFGPYNRINQNGPKEMGWRTNAQNLNLNRDYLKAESPEIQAWIALYNEWKPDFFIDCHVTDGADYQYALTYAMEINGNMEAGLTNWQTNIFKPEIEKRMVVSGFPLITYVEFKNWHDPRSGLRTHVSPPMLSHGYTAYTNRPSILIESHMLKDYKTRVTATYEMLKNTLAILSQQSKTLTNLNQQADDYTSGKKFRSEPLIVDFEASKTDSSMIDFLGFEYSVSKSDLSGGDWFTYSKKQETFKVPFFNQFRPKTMVSIPEAYIIPPEWTQVIQKLKIHGIKSFTLNRETKFMIKSYAFKNIKFRPNSYEGRQTVSFETDELSEERVFPAGSVIVETNQASAKIIAALLEPSASGSLAFWGYFNALFEQKEYAESYKMEVLAREMIQKNPDLLKELEIKKAADPDFARNSWEILNWFYARTPWWDVRKDMYPVGKIMDKASLEQLKK